MCRVSKKKMSLGFFVTANHVNVNAHCRPHSKLQKVWKLPWLWKVSNMPSNVEVWDLFPSLHLSSVSWGLLGRDPWLVQCFRLCLRVWEAAEKCSERGRHVGQRHERSGELQKDPFVAALPQLTALKDDIDAGQRHRKPARLINSQVCWG